MDALALAAFLEASYQHYLLSFGALAPFNRAAWILHHTTERDHNGRVIQIGDWLRMEDVDA